MAKAREITGVAPETPFGVYAARVIEVRAGEVQAVLASSDGTAETVHARRVALRRLRTALEVFGPVLPKRAKRVRRALKGVFATLGPRRDADVALAALRALEPRLAAADAAGFRSLVAALEADGASGGDLDADAAEHAREEALLVAARARDRNGTPAADALRAVASRRAAAVLARLHDLDAGDAEAAHDLRIAAKRLRYTLEAAAAGLGPAATEGAGVARELQDVLGELHDCDVLVARVERHRRDLRAQDVAAVAGGGAPRHGSRYRGLQAVDTLLRARRAELRTGASAAGPRLLARLEAAAAELGLSL